ncbi:MAG: TauD/TfdA family dioxygenase [Pseudomonadota bacterium]
MQTTKLTDAFGVKVHDIDLRDVKTPQDFAPLRALFETHSALLFKRQSIDEDDHRRLAGFFGEIEDRLKDERKPGTKAAIPLVSNETAAGVTGEMDLHTLNLLANQQWHSDSTFMPVPALCNILTARVVPSRGGETELASTRAAWAAMPEALKSRVRGRVFHHHYRTSRARISEELAALPMFNKWPAQSWPAIWRNPVTGDEALYIASHVYAVEGMDDAEGRALINDLIAFCGQPQFAYTHTWDVGDVLLWDQRAVLHRGRPWPMDEPRTLASLCISMAESDGLTAARAEKDRLGAA